MLCILKLKYFCQWALLWKTNKQITKNKWNSCLFSIHTCIHTHIMWMYLRWFSELTNRNHSVPGAKFTMYILNRLPLSILLPFWDVTECVYCTSLVTLQYTLLSWTWSAVMIQGSCNVTALAIFKTINLLYGAAAFFMAPLQLKRCARGEEWVGSREMMWLELCCTSINLSGLWSTEWHLRYLATDWVLSRVRWEVVKQEVFKGDSKSFGFWLFWRLQMGLQGIEL